MDRPAPLAGIRVLDFTRYLAGPFATMLLAFLMNQIVGRKSLDRV